ncbi:conserved hypothetical protein [Catenulispora acidiphila DSM 44928]|uniref:T4 RNA ligase 1-like N-terminal domain-containing protein n=1 Tax=Catenulispora acidiphila (strain DSM 44928 / JCM 14897 / NBRC 102108 / NRRL B-24433 / ID139908) TaxID=479433 RepID=C7Q2Z0_CATAD|nr:RNA ligase [Catenulispora acidiphila]ACU71882.1 conserved hypothetical protein [Catenulispora acidiphila DSM 44928]
MTTTTTSPLHLHDLFSPADLQAEIEAKFVTRKQHPTLPLSLYVYGQSCQYEHHWTPVTMCCRGLIVDDTTGRIVALPFPKIFVTGMHGVHDFAPPLPTEPFEIFEKVDGSLIIAFHYDGRWHAASKGSFASEQSAWAQARLDAADTSLLDPALTYLAEAIYPANRIVVDYGAREDLVLLAAYEPATGAEKALAKVAAHWAPIGPVVRSWGLGKDVREVEVLAADSRRIDGRTAGGTEDEGYVIRFTSGIRAKIKLSSYLALHKLYTGTNERTVWEVLASGQDPAVLFDTVPDEFAGWVRQVAARLRGEFDAYVAAARADFDAIGPTAERKSFAEQAMKSEHRAALFRLYDGRDIDDLAWKSIKPRGDVPFVTDEEG